MMHTFLLALLATTLSLDPGAAAPIGLKVTHSERSLQPGEIVRIGVESAERLTGLEARAFGRTFPLFEAVDTGSWEGLIGIDLDVPPGPFTIDITGKSSKGSVIREKLTLEVKSKNFPSRRITVEEKFVNPPKEELERIQRESRRVGEIFAEVSPARLWSGSFLAPVPGAPSSSFGKRSIVNGQVRSPHSGTDFSAGTGTPIKAPNAGRVVLAEDLYYSGNTVILDHGQGLYSYFAHLSRISVRAEEMVARGKVLGLAGATGRVTGPHLHWSVRLVRTRVDPLALMALTGEPSRPR